MCPLGRLGGDKNEIRTTRPNLFIFIKIKNNFKAEILFPKILQFFHITVCSFMFDNKKFYCCVFNESICRLYLFNNL